MQGNALKGIIAGIILVVLCFIVGAQAAESAISSAAVIAAIVGALVLILAGKRCWWLIFLLGPVVGALPLPAPLSYIPGPLYMSGVILVYWCLLWCMGYVKIRWRSFLLLDLLVFLLAAYVVAAYIRRPVSVQFLGLETDMMGGADYVYYAAAFVYYLALSCIPMEKGEFAKVLRWSVGVVLVCLFIKSSLAVARGGLFAGGVDDLRTEALYFFGKSGIAAICARFSFFAIALNPVLVAFAAVCSGGVLLSGGRERVGMVFFVVATIAIIKKELLSCFFIGGLALISIYAASAAGMIERAPLSAQRIASMLPGIKISGAVKRGTDGTWQWRLDLWDLAFDERTGYIENYVFGDGYGQSRSATQRQYRALIRGEAANGQDHEGFAENGVWHNGVITIIHRFGYVGLSLVFLILIVGTIYMFRVCFALRGSPLFFPVVFYVTGYAALIPELCLGAHGDRQFIFEFSSLALIKWMYCMLREEGKLIPLTERKRYIPQMIRDYGNELRNPVS